MAAAATAKNGSRPAFLEKSNGEQIPPSAQMSWQDAPTVEGAGQEQIAADELEPEEYSGPMEAAERDGEEGVAIFGNAVKREAVEEPNGTGGGEVDSERTKRGLALMPADNMITVGISKLFGPAKMRRVSANRSFPPCCGRTAPAVCGEETGTAQDGESERTTRNLGHHKSPALMLADDMLGGEISKVFGPAKKRRVSVLRRFPAGCGRTAAAACREEPVATEEGGSVTAARRASESNVKKKPEAAKSEVSKVELHKAKVVGLGNQAPRSSTGTNHKPLAVRHSPVGTGTNTGELLERSQGGQARGGVRGGEDDPAGLARGKRPPLPAKSPLLLPRGGAVGKGRDASEVATAPEFRADRIVMVLMAASRCPRRRGRAAK